MKTTIISDFYDEHDLGHKLERRKPSADEFIELKVYEAQCIKQKEYVHYKTKRLCLEWDFTLSGKEGIILPQYFIMEYKKFRESAYYYQNWVIANNLIQPCRATRVYMTPNIFDGLIARVIVKRSKPTFPNGDLMPQCFWNWRVLFIREVLLSGKEKH